MSATDLGPFLYHYRAEVLRVVDGDTVDLLVELGFYCGFQNRFRLAGIDAPEKNSADPGERAAAIKAADVLSSWLPRGEKVLIKTEMDRTEKYGRYLVWVFPESEAATISYNQFLVELGHARPYGGGARFPLSPGDPNLSARPAPTR